MKMYVVTYCTDVEVAISEDRSDWIRDYVCKLVSGQELADLYGFSDCSGDSDFKAWEVQPYGDLKPCLLESANEVPYNRLVIVPLLGNKQVYMWEEH